MDSYLLLGHGAIGTRHARILRNMGHRVVTVDPDPAAGADYLAVSELEAPLKDFAGVLDCTPPGVRAGFVVPALARFIEKPLGQFQFADDVMNFIKPVMMGFCYRWLFTLEAFVEKCQRLGVASLLLAGGQYIQQWHESDYRTVRQRYHGVVTDSLPHSIYIARWIMGDVAYCGSTTANVGGLGLDVEDTAGVLLAGPNGEPVLLAADYLREKRQFYAVAVTNDRQMIPWVFDPADAEVMYWRQMDKFVACCEGHIHVDYPNLADGVAVQKVLDQILYANIKLEGGDDADL